MSEFSVWAPAAERVELVIGEERRPMTPGAGGWWRLAVPAAGPATDYAYALDGGPARPDPRSRWQPAGVHGPSRVVDLSGLEWQAGWRGFHLPSAVLYELHIGTFTREGTFAAAIDRLDHLVELGVTAVSVMPVNAFPGRHGWGYDGVGLWAVHEPYGGPAGLAAFVDGCHTRGLGVILDVVYNHLGPSGNYLGEFGPYFTDRYANPWGMAVNFDQAWSDEVRRFFIDNALMWLRDYRIDGLRLDAVHAIVDTSAVHFLEELAGDVERLAGRVGRPLWLIPESDLNDPRLLWSPERGGYGLHAQWSDDLHHALHAVLTGERGGYYDDFGRLEDIASALRRAYVYDGRHSSHRGRRHGRPADGLAGWRFLAYLQNHDQVGNRATGDRIGAIAGTDLQKVGAALVLTSPFIPMLFQGEEWAASTPFQYFTDHDAPELAEAVRKGRREEFVAFGWAAEEVPDPQDPDTFLRSRLAWAERLEEPHAGVERWYRQLLALRRARTGLRDGRREDVTVRADEDAGTLVVRRGDIAVCCNLSGAERAIGALGPRPRILLASAEGAVVDGAAVRVPPRSAVILEAVKVVEPEGPAGRDTA
ncbi:MAG TPA: malto-oligosyltrehalose trehalohydrolase [Longimicrobiales bacterium]|nr:malto-oligosyltrehalose trehalohydrolase [Longimicrobiales bacterium]